MNILQKWFLGKNDKTLTDKVEKIEYENSTLKNTLYKVGNSFLYGSQIIGAAMSEGTEFRPPTDPLIISKTCGFIDAAIFKITNWISKYSWKSDSQELLAFLEEPNQTESFTDIIRMYCISMLTYGEAFWDISNNLINPLPPTNVKVKWDENKIANDDPKFKDIRGAKAYYFVDENGIDTPLDNVVHFILQPCVGELRGTSKISIIQNHVNMYYYLCNNSEITYNRNKTPKMLINTGSNSTPDQSREVKASLMNCQNPNEPFVFGTDTFNVYEPDKQLHFADDFIKLQDWFKKLVYLVYGLSETDQGLVSATKASAETHDEQTEKTIVEALMDTFAEKFNKSTLVDVYGGDFQWDDPDVETEMEGDKTEGVDDEDKKDDKPNNL